MGWERVGLAQGTQPGLHDPMLSVSPPPQAPTHHITGSSSLSCQASSAVAGLLEFSWLRQTLWRAGRIWCGDG